MKKGQNEFLLDNQSDDSSSSMSLVVDKAQEGELQIEQMQDTNVYDVDIENIKDKPWLKAGADITDYFNYGFTEKTWLKYCEMQKERRGFAEEHNYLNEKKPERQQYDTMKYNNRDDCYKNNKERTQYEDNKRRKYNDRPQYDNRPQYNDRMPYDYNKQYSSNRPQHSNKQPYDNNRSQNTSGSIYGNYQFQYDKNKQDNSNKPPYDRNKSTYDRNRQYK